MKISFCGCAINAKNEVRRMVEFINEHNQDEHFEICLALDNRVDDGSKEEFDKLVEEYPTTFRYIEVTHADTVEYMEKLCDYYVQQGKFQHVAASGHFVDHLRENVRKFANHELTDETKQFVWFSSGRLYNRAVEISSGSVIVVGPADFIPMYRVRDIRLSLGEVHGSFYSKPHAIFTRISNQDKAWLEKTVNDIHNGIGTRSGYRYDTDEVFLDYLRYPSPLEECFAVDAFRNKLICLKDPNCIEELHELSRLAHSRPGMQCLKNFHGTHIMSRDIFDKIGGFTEEFYGRAFADDKMTALGKRYFKEAPDHISFAWIHVGEIATHRGPGYEPGWQNTLKERDPYWDRHPIPPGSPHYLHDTIDIGGRHFPDVVNNQFNIHSNPVRIT